MKTSLALIGAAATLFAGTAIAAEVELGPRPYYLIDQMKPGALKDALAACEDMEMTKQDFSIGHRGAPLMFPEHTEQSYRAAARMGAGILECDVAFTADKELVCRHAQNDLHTTTNILASDLAGKCTTPFTGATTDTPASAECRTSDITLAEFKSLNGKMDAYNPEGSTPEEYMDGTAGWRTDLYATEGTLLSHAESIELFKELGAKFTPELKSPAVEMPFDGYTQEDYAQALIDEYKAAGVPAADVWAQSFNLNDVLYWIENEPEFGAQAVYLIEPAEGFDHANPETWPVDPAETAAQGVKYLAPSMNMLVTAEGDEIRASDFAKAAKEAGLKLISWTLERSGPLAGGGGWYFNSITEATDYDADYFEVLHVLAEDVGIEAMFSDWPATTTYYANCMGAGTGTN